jgi:type II secretory pathway component PulJ
MRRQRRGFTLAETVVMLVIFSLFSTTALATLTLALRYWSQSNQRTLAEQNVRVSLQTITSELRQAIIDPDPGATNQATGYLSISPAVQATAYLMPNPNVTSSSETLTFNEPNEGNFDPSQSGFDSTNPSNYLKVTYTIQNNALHRQQISYTTTGTVAAITDDIVASASASGALTFTARYASASSLSLTLSAQEGSSNFIISATVPMYVQ